MLLLFLKLLDWELPSTCMKIYVDMCFNFYRSLIRALAEVISTEARAFANKQQAGLTFFAPFMNIYR